MVFLFSELNECGSRQNRRRGRGWMDEEDDNGNDDDDNDRGHMTYGSDTASRFRNAEFIRTLAGQTQPRLDGGRCGLTREPGGNKEEQERLQLTAAIHGRRTAKPGRDRTKCN